LSENRGCRQCAGQNSKHNPAKHRASSSERALL
jgi:hypothetical protein